MLGGQASGEQQQWERRERCAETLSERRGADDREPVSEKKRQHYFAVGISVTFT